jgi:hypothetical protein
MLQAPVYMSKVRDMAEPIAMDLDRRDPNNLNEHLQASPHLHIDTIVMEDGLP